MTLHCGLYRMLTLAQVLKSTKVASPILYIIVLPFFERLYTHYETTPLFFMVGQCAIRLALRCYYIYNS